MLTLFQTQAGPGLYLHRRRCGLDGSRVWGLHLVSDQCRQLSYLRHHPSWSCILLGREPMGPAGQWRLLWHFVSHPFGCVWWSQVVPDQRWRFPHLRRHHCGSRILLGRWYSWQDGAGLDVHSLRTKSHRAILRNCQLHLGQHLVCYHFHLCSDEGGAGLLLGQRGAVQHEGQQPGAVRRGMATSSRERRLYMGLDLGWLDAHLRHHHWRRRVLLGRDG